MKQDVIDLSKIPGFKYKVMNRFFQNRRDSDAPHTCFFGHPNGTCNNNSIISHVFPRSLLKKYIARDGQVYMPDSELSTLRKTNGKISNKLVGVSKATTFYGFCQRHDSEVFLDIDTDNWLPTEKQIVLSYFRSLCYELHQKYRAHSNMSSLHDMLSEAADIRPDNGTTIFQASARAQELSLQNYFPEFSDLQKAIIELRFSGYMHYASWATESRLPVACFGLFNPIYDVEGKVIQRPETLSGRLENAFIAIVPTGGGSKISVASRNTNLRALQFIKSLLQGGNDQIADIVVKTMMANSESVCCNPTWYDTLSPRKRKLVLKLMQQMISTDAPYKKTPILIEDMAFLEATSIN